MLNFHNSYYANFFLFMFVLFNQSILVMKHCNFYFDLSDGQLVKVSKFRFYLRLWFHFPIKNYRLSVVHAGCFPDDLVLVWLKVLSFDLDV